MPWANGRVLLTSFVLLAGAPRGMAAAGSCSDLLRMPLENGALSAAADVPAGQPASPGQGATVEVTSLPAHCLVRGEVNHHRGTDGREYGDKFELRMPAEWQGRLLFIGGGGLDGMLHPALGLQGAVTKPDSKSALSMGYAVVTTDGGHQDPRGLDGSFGADPEARADYDYRSTQRVTAAARAIIAQYYGRPIRYSYFQGCSNGGREGLVSAQRYPDTFDGIIAGAPAFNLTHAAIAEAWSTVQLASIAPRKADGTADLSQSLTEADLTTMVDGLLAQCDSLDGLKDNLIFNPAACHFDPSILLCTAHKATGCLTAEKVKVIRAVFDGPHDSSGRAIYSKWPYDSGNSAEGWRVWTTGLHSMPSINVQIFPQFFNGLALAGVPPPIDIFTFDFDHDPARIQRFAAEINATSTDWSAFRKRGAKLLLYTGMSDPVFSADDLIRYYGQIAHDNGGQRETASFARLFLVPGMTHCSGGPALDEFDTLTAMQSWVEQGAAPDRMRSSGRAFPGRSRPLCAYPQIARYNGKGAPEEASSFHCIVP